VTAAQSAGATMWQDLATSEFTLSFVDAGGVRTRVVTAGAGPALLLLHGTGGHLETYQKNITALSKRFRVIVPDMIGHGYTGRPDVKYTLDDYADHAFALLDSLGAGQAFVSGESLGGCVAAWMALRAPARVPALVLNTGILEKPDQAGLRQLADLGQRTRQLMENLSLDTIRRRMEWLVLDPATMTDEMISVRYAIYSQPGMVADVQRILHAVLEMNRGVYAGTDYINRELLREISCPTLVLWSDHNPGKPLDRVKPAIELIPDVAVSVVRDAAHWPQFEQPAQVNRQMIDFLAGLR
jgi:2-hydroxy-6-oxonona-2,4-dienedioate hydrolase